MVNGAYIRRQITLSIQSASAHGPMTTFMQSLSDLSDHETRDARLDRALDLLDHHEQRSRYGTVSLVAVVALACSGTLLFTLMSGSDDKPAAPAKVISAPAAASSSSAISFELSGSASESASSPVAQTHAPVREAVLIGTER